MTKTNKILLTLAAIPVVLIVCVVIAAMIYFTSDRLQELVIPPAEKATQRTISTGDLTLSIIPNLMLKVEDLKISNPEGKTFDQRDFFTVDELVVDISLLPLLKKALIVNEVTIQHPRIYLEVNEKGAANYEFGDVDTGTIEETRPKEEGKATDFKVVLTNFQILDGEIEYVDKVGDQHALIEGYNQKLKIYIENGGDILLQSEASLESLSYGSVKKELISGLPLETVQHLRYRLAEDILSVDSVRIAIREIALNLKGNIITLQTEPQLDLSLKSSKKRTLVLYYH